MNNLTSKELLTKFVEYLETHIHTSVLEIKNNPIIDDFIKTLPMCPKCGTNNVSQDEDGQYTCNVCED